LGVPIMSSLHKAIVRSLRMILGEVGVIELSRRMGRSSQNDFYDRLTTQIMRRVLREDSVCVDVGCHEGAILTVMLQIAHKGTFLAFEPLPDFYRGLQSKYGARVRVFPYALGDEIGTANFKFVETNPAYSGLRERQYDRAEERVVDIAVEERTLDWVVEKEGIAGIDFIKIDVEGAEILVLRGAEKAIRSSKPIIVFEHGKGAGDRYCAPEDIFRFFEKCGMRISTLVGFLRARLALSERGFRERFAAGEYYFVAHPAKS